jgi:hypothetical protein
MIDSEYHLYAHNTCEEMERLISNQVTGYVEEVDYNVLNTVTSFIKFYQQQPLDQKVQQVFEAFTPDSSLEAQNTKGTNCVGKAQDLARRLEARRIKAHVVAAGPGDGKPVDHGAVVVPCRDGILLLEVDNPDPIVALRPNEPFDIVYRGDPDLILSFRFNEETGIITRTDYKGSEKIHQVEYHQDPNPDSSVMKRWLACTKFYPVSTGARAGVIPHSLQVNVRLGKITFNRGQEKFRLPFDALDALSFDKSRLTSDDGQPSSLQDAEYFLGSDGRGGPFFDAFKTAKAQLIDQIFTIKVHEKIIKEILN